MHHPSNDAETDIMTKRRVWWGDYRTTEYASIDPETTIAVLPVAAIEQHGPHLPVSADTTIMNAMLAEAMPLVPAGLDVLVLPTLAICKSSREADFVDPIMARLKFANQALYGEGGGARDQAIYGLMKTIEYFDGLLKEA